MDESNSDRLRELIKEVGMDNIFEVLEEEIAQISARDLIENLTRYGLEETALFKLEEHLIARI